MFSGIVEEIGIVKKISKSGQNKTFTIEAPIASHCYIDQSIAHNGVCLTVIGKNKTEYAVTAIHETLLKSNLKKLEIGDQVNLEKAMTMDKLLDGHMVQGHVDGVVNCESITPENGSWRIGFSYDTQHAALIVSKGSICLNGISLTIISPTVDYFEVSIIPYTWANTNLNQLKLGDHINVEFDILGKYVQRYLQITKVLT